MLSVLKSLEAPLLLDLSKDMSYLASLLKKIGLAVSLYYLSL
jgi:hypothetical protein